MPPYAAAYDMLPLISMMPPMMPPLFCLLSLHLFYFR